MDLFLLFAVCIGLNLLMFIPAFVFRTDKLTDITYAATFAVVALLGYWHSDMSLPKILLTIMIFSWAIRLGSYLFARINKIGRDKRFDDKRDSFIRFGSFWLLQGVSVAVIMIPSAFFYQTGSNSALYYLGFAVWLAGLLIESVADRQKYKFISDSTNSGKWIDTGLWKYSRHPNYFGEILVWLGVYIFCLSALSTTQAIIGLISPLYIFLLIRFVSGVPLLEKTADEKWGSDMNYIAYKKRTSVLVLLPNKK